MTMEILLLVVGLLLFVFLVIVHEFGHFIVARRNGVDVEEFGIGFPPKLVKVYTDKKGTDYTLNLLPLGGFVRLKGEHDSDTEKGTFGAARFAAKVKIMLAGVSMNLITAWLILSILALTGLPLLPLPNNEVQFTIPSDTKSISNKVYVGYVEPDGPADLAGVKPGDQVLGVLRLSDIVPQGSCGEDSYDGICRQETVKSAAQIRQQVETIISGDKQTFIIQVIRGGMIKNIAVQSRSLAEVKESEQSDDPKGYIGIEPHDFTLQRSTWSAPIVAGGLIAQYTRLTLGALGSTIASLFRGHGSEAGQNVSGPIGIFVVLKDGASFGLTYIMLIIALLSLTLAIMNALPIPALDGGKLAVMALFRIIRKPLTPSVEEWIHGSGFFALMAVFVLITIVDVRRFF